MGPLGKLPIKAGGCNFAATAPFFPLPRPPRFYTSNLIVENSGKGKEGSKRASFCCKGQSIGRGLFARPLLTPPLCGIGLRFRNYGTTCFFDAILSPFFTQLLGGICDLRTCFLDLRHKRKRNAKKKSLNCMHTVLATIPPRSHINQRPNLKR